MAYLLDANVLIALGDTNHVHHDRVQSWFHSSERQIAWATCPLTENAFLRIVGGPSYPPVEGGIGFLRQHLDRMCSWPGHQFWPDDLSFRDTSAFPEMPSSRQLTDLYLLGLAISHQGQLAPLDQRIDPGFLDGGKSALFLIP